MGVFGLHTIGWLFYLGIFIPRIPTTCCDATQSNDQKTGFLPWWEDVETL